MDLIRKLEQSREREEGIHMPHVYYGDPTQEFSEKLVMTLSRSGADIIEFGIPFSDPTADGPTFIAACERALNKGVTPKLCIDAIKKLRQKGVKLPIIVTSYYNILYVAGVKRFLKEIKKAGGQGVIVPNLPIEEARTLLDAATSTGIHPILQVTPTTTGDRLRKICDASSGFIYVINVEGVTGARDKLHNSTIKLVERVRSLTDTPILAGFGVSNPKHARLLLEAGADGVIVGSIYARIYEKHLENPDRSLPQISRLAYEIKQACIEGVKDGKVSRVEY
jgi:tryptophan synthase alpha chain